MDATVRSALPGDSRRLVELHTEFGDYYATLAPDHFQRPDVTQLEDELERDIASSAADSIFLVIDYGGEILAAAAAHILVPVPEAAQDINADASATRLQIDYLVTTTSQRRGGLATRLIDAIEAWGRTQGATLAVTSTYSSSPLSMPFWHDRMGYETRSINLRKPL